MKANGGEGARGKSFRLVWHERTAKGRIPNTVLKFRMLYTDYLLLLLDFPIDRFDLSYVPHLQATGGEGARVRVSDLRGTREWLRVYYRLTGTVRLG